MLVKERMSAPVVTVKPHMPIMDAMKVMREQGIRRLPVVKNEQLVGIVSETDLVHASPSDVTSLSVWEINYLLSQIVVRDVMTKQVLTVEEGTPIEEAARIMADNKVGGLPVLRGNEVIGIITETNLFNVLLEMMGAREVGVRVTALVPDEPGQLARITEAVAADGGTFISFGQAEGEGPQNRLVTFKVAGVAIDLIRSRIEPLVAQLIDVRMCGG